MGSHFEQWLNRVNNEYEVLKSQFLCQVGVYKAINNKVPYCCNLSVYDEIDKIKQKM